MVLRHRKNGRLDLVALSQKERTVIATYLDSAMQEFMRLYAVSKEIVEINPDYAGGKGQLAYAQHCVSCLNHLIQTLAQSPLRRKARGEGSTDRPGDTDQPVSG